MSKILYKIFGTETDVKTGILTRGSLLMYLFMKYLIIEIYVCGNPVLM